MRLGAGADPLFLWRHGLVSRRRLATKRAHRPAPTAFRQMATWSHQTTTFGLTRDGQMACQLGCMGAYLFIGTSRAWLYVCYASKIKGAGATRKTRTPSRTHAAVIEWWGGRR